MTLLPAMLADISRTTLLPVKLKLMHDPLISVVARESLGVVQLPVNTNLGSVFEIGSELETVQFVNCAFAPQNHEMPQMKRQQKNANSKRNI